MRARRLAWVAGLFLAAACGDGGLTPRPLPTDRVNCTRCGMLISDEAYAAEAVIAGEEARFYDDVGCLARDAMPSGRFAQWVKVGGGKSWRRAETAYYARPAGARTPMGYGLVACATREEARSRDREGRAIGWGDLVSEVASGGPR